MSDAFPRRVGLAPSLAEVLANPAVLDRLAVDVLLDLRRQVRHLHTDLDAAIVRQLADRRGQVAAERVVGVEEAAKRLLTSEDTLYAKWKKLPFAYKDPLDGKIKFRMSGIDRYLASRRGED